IGSGAAGLRINGELVPVWPNGAFLGWIPNPAADAQWYDLEAYTLTDTARLRYPVRTRAGIALLGPRPPTVPEVKRFDPPLVATLRDDSMDRAVSDTDNIIIGRPTPTGDYKWFLLPGTPVRVVEFRDDMARVQLDSDQDIWVARRDVKPESSESKLEDLRVTSARMTASAATVDVDLHVASPPAYVVGESERELTLTLYNTTSSATFAPIVDSLIESATQSTERTRTVYHFALSRPLYGYLVTYENGVFRLAIRRPPVVDASAPLRGMTIVVDPGHPPIGATGPTGLWEPVATLAVGLRVEQLLEARGDLYATRNGHDVRLTDNQRLSEPSVRADGRIVAVQTAPSTTRLVLVSTDGREILPITTASLDTQWTAPRWSPDGTRLVAVRMSGATNEVVVLDSTGQVVATPVRERAVIRSPAWLPDGHEIIFTSDIGGIAQLAIVSATSNFADAAPVRLTAEPGGVYGADAVSAHGDSVRVVTTAMRGDGYHVLVWTVRKSALGAPPGRAAAGASRDGTAAVSQESPSDPRWHVTDDTSRARSYSPWRTLAPAYWSPTFAQAGSGRGNLIGALTSASDVIGRHSYVAQAAVNLHNSNVDASLSYVYNRWVNPMLSVSLDQSWSYSNITSAGVKVGDLERRSRFASVHATFARPRVRTYSAVTIGAEFEERDYGTNPGSLLPRLDPFYDASHRYPTLVAAAVFSNTQRPTLSISPEDGFTATGSLRQRWEASSGASGRSAVVIGSAYKSLDLPGFAHHVIAVRAAIGAADRRSPSEYSIGGVSGSSIEIVPGITFGSAARTFPVRGFAAGAETGINASSVSAEYRIPLVAPSRSLGLFPFFLDRASLALFSDAAHGSCPVNATP
ncbi:MAG: hypothetical protein ACHQQP_06490, partial [Gemmatimonadales bacterium]